jgi:uncharacterized protein (TIGR03435 family)
MMRAVLSLLLVATLGFPLAGQALEFEVASIRRNTSATPIPSGPPPNPASGQMTLSWIPARFLATRAYPDLTTPLVVEGLPAWADSERYDVTVKFRPGATPAEQAEMWKALLADRMKLRAHYETKPRTGYRLVVARPDRRLGPQLTPATIECPTGDASAAAPPPAATREMAMAVLSQRRAPTAQEEAALMSRCSSLGIGDRLYAGSIDIKSLTQSLQFMARLDGPIVDATGLEGRYAIKLWAARAPGPPLTAAPGTAVEPGVDDAPPLFSALQDQLGLKLERTTIDGKILVVDHIERPTEN